MRASTRPGDDLPGLFIMPGAYERAQGVFGRIGYDGIRRLWAASAPLEWAYAQTILGRPRRAAEPPNGDVFRASPGRDAIFIAAPGERILRLVAVAVLQPSQVAHLRLSLDGVAPDAPAAPDPAREIARLRAQVARRRVVLQRRRESGDLLGLAEEERAQQSAKERLRALGVKP